MARAMRAMPFSTKKVSGKVYEEHVDGEEVADVVSRQAEV